MLVLREQLLKTLKQLFAQHKHTLLSLNAMTGTSPKSFSHRGASCKLNCILLQLFEDLKASYSVYSCT